MSSFTQDELRRAIVALFTVEQHGDRDEWACIVRRAQDSAPSGEPWGNDAIGARVNAGILAGRLSGLLGVDAEQCELAAEAVFCKSRQLAVFDALITYAAELKGHTSHRKSPTTSTACGRPAVRIVADERGAA